MADSNFFDLLRRAMGQTTHCEPKDIPEDISDDGIFRPDESWQPKHTKRRVEIMVPGDPQRVKEVRKAVEELQNNLFKEAGGPDNLELRITAFLDGCKHTTRWSSSPINVASRASWGCYEGETLFVKALQASSDEDLIDAIIIFGHRFDDNLEQALRVADQLKTQGTRIFAFHLGENLESRSAYEQLADHTNGVFLQLTDQRSIHEIMPIITNYLKRGEEALAELEAPKNPDLKLLIDRLKEPAPGNDGPAR